ncbi:MAG: tetratricopeptide repeat protein [Planctomycetia bacterium]|nr:tetratricopeptide repeat protein [Planctomycetia bacterium]
MNPPSATPRMPQSPALAGERVAFTGTLASMTHREAQARVVECGGAASEHVSRQTTLLVIGEEGWPLEPDGQPSVKLRHVERLNADGLDIRIVRESEWLGFVGLDARREELHRRCTPAMLSRMLDVSVHQIRRWERMGLIKAVAHVCRLPYFDFQEAAGARRLAELVDAGVPVREIQASLARLESVIGIGSRPLAQLDILAADRHLLYRDPRGRLKTSRGQRLFDFAGPPPAESQPGETVPLKSEDRAPRPEFSATDWFEEGRRLADQGDLPAAVEAFRMSLMEEHDAPEVQFQLAEALYRQGQVRAALERYHVAAELDRNYLEAWTQIGCLLAELGDLSGAVDAFDIALDIHPDFPDAHLHKAESLHQAGRTADAIPHWQKYLDYDQSGPWAEAARQRLKEAGAS